MFRYFTILFCSILIISCEYESFESEKDLQTPLASCVDGVAKIPGTDLEFSCLNYDLVGYVSLEDMDAKSANDVWGWTDSFGKEYAIIGLDNGTAFIDISDPVKPIYLGKLPTQTVSTIWRDIKTNKNYAYIVADFNSLTPEQDRNHGLQVFDLTKLSSANESPLVFSNDYLYDDFGKAHNIAINEKTNFLYAVGTETFQGGIHIVDLVDPLVPVFSQGFSEQGYSHDAQVVTYEGPDTEPRGKEIL
jgi:choice-of-anchor B domain-containing protein